MAQSAAGALLAIAMAGKWAQEAAARVGGPATVKEVRATFWTAVALSSSAAALDTK